MDYVRNRFNVGIFRELCQHAIHSIVCDDYRLRNVECGPHSLEEHLDYILLDGGHSSYTYLCLRCQPSARPRASQASSSAASHDDTEILKRVSARQ